jgi:hypothetical protein
LAPRSCSQPLRISPGCAGLYIRCFITDLSGNPNSPAVPRFARQNEKSNAN